MIILVWKPTLRTLGLLGGLCLTAGIHTGDDCPQMAYVTCGTQDWSMDILNEVPKLFQYQMHD